MRSLLVSAATALLFRFGLIKLWQRVPRRLRRVLVARLVQLPPQQADDTPVAPAPPVWVVGFFNSNTSLGWVARATFRMFAESGAQPIAVDVSDRFGTRHFQGGTAGTPVEPGPGTIVLCVNPNQIALALSTVPRAVIAGKYLIGVFVYELERIPESWKPPLFLMHEIHVPTRFVADAFAATGYPQPIRIKPYRIDAPPGTVSSRNEFALPEKQFLVLSAANLRSGLARKNLDGAIEAFATAFGDRNLPATLVLKLHDGALSPVERDKVRQAASRIDARIIESDLDEVAIWRLIASCDAVLSMHRAEGYGLLLKQGLLLGKPVVATAWSGNMDYMTDVPNAYLVDCALVPVKDPQQIYETGSDGLRWAEPDVASAAGHLRTVFDAWAAQQRC